MQKLIIQEILKKRGITQSELSYRLGLKQSSLSRTLSTKTAKGISVSTLLQIADICCCDVREFFTDKRVYLKKCKDDYTQALEILERNEKYF